MKCRHRRDPKVSGQRQPGRPGDRQIYRYTSLKSCSKWRSCRHCSSFRWCLHQNCSKAFSVSSSWARSLKHATGNSLDTYWKSVKDCLAIIKTKMHYIIYKRSFDNCHLSTVVWFSISSGLSLWFSDLAACSLMQPNKVVPCFKASFSSSWFRDTEASDTILISSVTQLPSVRVKDLIYTCNVQSFSGIVSGWWHLLSALCLFQLAYANLVWRSWHIVKKGSDSGYCWEAATACKARVSWQTLAETAKGICRILLSTLAKILIVLPQFRRGESNLSGCHS